MSDQSACFQIEAGTKWKQWRQKCVRKGIFRHGGDGRWWQGHDGEAGEQQSFHLEWHPSVTFTEKMFEALRDEKIEKCEPEKT